MDIKNIIFAAGGAVAGSVGTYFFMKKKMENTINEEVNKEVAAMQEYYISKYSDNEATPEKEESEEKEEQEEVELPDYSKYRTETVDIPDEVVTQAYEDPDVGRVHRITEEEFDEDFRYSKENLVYYEEDAVLTDDIDCPVLVEDTIVDEALLDFEDCDRVFIRNTEIGIDYEVEVKRRSSTDPAN